MTYLADRTPAQRRLFLTSLRGKLAELTISNEPERLLGEVVDLAYGADSWRQSPTLLIVRHYAESRLVVIPIKGIEAAEQREWPVTDPRHPDYQQERQVVRPLPRRNR